MRLGGTYHVKSAGYTIGYDCDGNCTAQSDGDATVWVEPMRHLPAWRRWPIMARGFEIFVGADVARRGILWATGAADFRDPDGSVTAFYIPLANIMDAMAWGIQLTVVGLALVIAVVVNGMWYPTPFIRMACIILAMIPTAGLTVSFAIYGTSGSAVIAWTGELQNLLFLSAALLFCTYDTARNRQGHAPH